MNASFFNNKIEYLKGVGPKKAALLNTELNIFTYADLIQFFPFRYEDRTHLDTIKDIRLSNNENTNVQLKGQIKYLETIGLRNRSRLVASFRDGTGEIELVWFKGVHWVKQQLKPGVEYIVYGKLHSFQQKLSIPHPEITPALSQNEVQGLQPVYHTTEKLKRTYMDTKAISKIMKSLLEVSMPHIQETLSRAIIQKYDLINKQDAIFHIHFPENEKALKKAQNRLKFEELFYVQLRLLKQKIHRTQQFKGQIFKNTTLLTRFYEEHLPFELTKAQKRVIKEIYKDLSSGQQMNRLLQGDVGSGKTIVAFIIMLLALGSDCQTCLMAPTEILAEQHLHSLKPYADALNLHVELLTGSSTTSERKFIHDYLENGDLQVLIGTHALLEDKVKFQNLGLCIIDEQHRFGVKQRSKLWEKNKDTYPHILVMTATPIPRTLAMTVYGDLDVSVIDELPPGRKPVKTVHQYETDRLKLFGFIRQELAKGKQVYIVYPLIEESEKLDLNHLMDGYESISRAFPDHPVSIVHGKMKAKDKDYEMQRFVRNETHIMVATTVIEVGVNVPNASIMIIENAERFGLSQLHQLRGRVGRGADQSYCILMTSYKISREARSRIQVMVATNDGFEIANQDLKIRGPGDLMGTQQSGILDLLVADLAKDAKILEAARETAKDILREDPDLLLPRNEVIKKQLERTRNLINWSRIS